MIARVARLLIPDGACVDVRKRGTAPSWLNAIIKKGPYPFFGMRQAKRLPGLAEADHSFGLRVRSFAKIPSLTDATMRLASATGSRPVKIW
jgi:hypothetical protein